MSDNQRPDAGAQRPTGKRQRSGASTTSSADYAKKHGGQVATASPQDEKPGNGVVSFLPEVVTEVKKVVWPTGKEMVQYTLVTFGFLIVLTALVWSVDTLTGLGVEWVLTP